MHCRGSGLAWRKAARREETLQTQTGWIIRQGLHPHPGPTGHGCGFDDSQESGWDEEGNEDADEGSSAGWPRGDGHSNCSNEEGEENDEQLFARGPDDGPVLGGEVGEGSMADGEGEFHGRIGPSRPSMLTNSNHSVWKDLEALDEEDCIPHLAGDSSDDE